MSKGQTDFSKRGQGKSTDRMPQKRNSTTFSKTHQPDNYDHLKGERGSANRKKRYTKKTQAQDALANAGHNPMQVLIGMSEKYQKMIADGVNWTGMPATSKELDAYVREFTKINENLATYQSCKAPVQTEDDTPEQNISGPEVVDENAPLTDRQLMNARKNMIARLDDKL